MLQMVMLIMVLKTAVFLMILLLTISWKDLIMTQ